MIALLSALLIYNIDTELWQLLLGSYGDPNLKDTVAGMYGVIAAALTVDTMHSVLRRCSNKIFMYTIEIVNFSQPRHSRFVYLFD